MSLFSADGNERQKAFSVPQASPEEAANGSGGVPSGTATGQKVGNSRYASYFAACHDGGRMDSSGPSNDNAQGGSYA